MAREGLKGWLRVPALTMRARARIAYIQVKVNYGHRCLYVQYRGAETGRFWKLVYQHHSQHVHTLTHTFKHTHGKKGTNYSGDTMHIAVGTASGYW